MGTTFQLALCLAMLALCFASQVNKVRWCVKSDPEMRKCRDLANTCSCASTSLSCIRRVSATDCIKAISEGEADAVTLDSGEIYTSSLNPYNLQLVAAENYGTKEAPDTCYFSVALVSKLTDFQFKDLKGKKCCGTGIGRAAGWNSPIGTLLANGLIIWKGPDEQPIEKAVAEFFSACCVPGSTQPELCKQCSGIGENKCKASEAEGYFGYAGAFKCLQDGKGDVAFVKNILPADASKDFELLCPDNTRKPISEHKNCYLTRISGHAVVTEKKEDKIKAVTQFLEEAQKKTECKLFSSPHGKDLMFKDSAKSLLPLPEKMDSFIYMGQKFAEASKALHTVVESPSQKTMRWCTQSTEEKNKCDTWSMFSEGATECVEGTNAEECIKKVVKGEADAVTLDGGYLYTAGECGLVPVMQEIYDAEECKLKRSDKKGSYYAVVVVKKSNKAIKWPNLKGVKSCHTALGRTAGYNIPVGLIHKETGICDLTTYFKESCIPGADPKSNLCKLCAGNPSKSRDTKCFANSQEQYYGYEGALRCLIETGDVCFVKDSTLKEVFESKNPRAWAKNWKIDDFELLCPDGSRKSIDQFKECSLAMVPAHAVASRPERKDAVLQILKEHAKRFGKNSQESEMFKLFDSEGPKDQLFKDSTQCLREVQETTMKDYLGNEYYNAVSGLGECGKSGLLAACTFHTCKL